MSTVNMFQAKSQLSRLVAQIESGAEAEIIIARNGRPAARLVAMSKAPQGRRIGVAKGKFIAPEATDAYDDQIAEMFGVETPGR